MNALPKYVFTTALSQKGKIQFFESHIERLIRDAQQFNFEVPSTRSIEAAVAPHVSQEPRLIKICIGQAFIDVTSRAPVLPTREHYEQGIDIILTNIVVDPKLAPYKTNIRTAYDDAFHQVRQLAAFEGLLVDHSGHVIDGTRTSPMLFRDNCLISLLGGIPGVTRAHVLQEAQKLGLHIESAYLKPKDLNGILLIAGSGIGLLSSEPVYDERIQQLIQSFRLG